MSDAKCCAATPHGTLLEQIMDSTQPKNEREWAARREIEYLRQQVEYWRDTVRKEIIDDYEKQLAAAPKPEDVK